MEFKKYTQKDFYWTSWKEDDIRKIVPEILKKKKRIYQKIKDIKKEKRTFKNTVCAIASSDDDFSHYIYKLHFLLNVSPKKKIREEAKKALDLFEKEIVEIEYDKEIYNAILEYLKVRKNKKLKPEDQKLLDDMLVSYKRMGFALSDKNQKELKSILKKISELQSQFSKNVNDYQDFILVDKKDLDGLPESYISALRKQGNRYKVGLSYPELIPFLELSKSAKKRKELTDKNVQKGGRKNLKIAKEILSLRKSMSSLLGYKNYADYACEVKMAKNSKNVFKFINDILPKLKPLAKRDIEKIEKLKGKKINYYDVSFYANKLKEGEYGVDGKKVKEYFPFLHVKKGVFEVYSKLFSIKFERVKNFSLWHKDVEFYKIKEGKNTIAYFGLDMYPREGKYGHAAVFEIQNSYQKEVGKKVVYIPPIVCMVSNIQKPTKKNPSLMSHDEVETFFHEFGHIMHQCLCRVKYSAQTSFKVSWDFVEAPSQMLENWVWNKDILKMLSCHYKTKEKMPDHLIDALIKSKKHFSGYDATRQFCLALFDMLVHTDYVLKNEKDLTSLWKKTMENWIGIKISPKNLQPAGFAHIFGGGYSAGYYGYMWSKVYALDMFERFKKEGVLNKKTGKDYKNWILKNGASKKEMDIVKGFLGRRPSPKAFLKDLGI